MAVYTGRKLRFSQNGDDYILDPVSVLEYADEEHFPATGLVGKIYIALDTNVMYRWDSVNEEYVLVSSSGGGAAFNKIDFSIATTDWTSVTGGYSYTITNSGLMARSSEIVTYDSSIEGLTSNIKGSKDAANHQYTFTVDDIPSGTISGVIMSFCDVGSGAQTVFEDFSFELETTDWVGDAAPYTATVQNDRVKADSGIWRFYGPSYDLYAKAAIEVVPINGGVTFSTYIKPTGTISGFIRVVDSINGTIPPERGGTGGRTPAEACAALGAIPTSQKGVANGVATLDGNGLIPSNLLPSYVDDVLEYDSTAVFPESGEIGKIYVAKDTNKSYRWSGSGYVELSSYALATAAAAGLMSAADKEKLDGIAAGAQANPGNATQSAAGLMSAGDKKILDGIISYNLGSFSTLAALEAAILAKAAEVTLYSVQNIYFTTSAAMAPFASGLIYIGTLYCGGSTTRCSVVFNAYAGSDPTIINGNQYNGTWHWTNLSSIVAGKVSTSSFYATEMPFSTGDSTKISGMIDGNIMTDTSFTGDIDTVKKAGRYYLQNASCTTGSLTGLYGVLFVGANGRGVNQSRVVQLFIPVFENKYIMQRHLGSSTWGSFRKISVNEDVYYGESSTAAGTQAKTATISNFPDSLFSGLKVVIKFTNNQTYNGQPTLNINSLGAKGICRNGTTAAARYEWRAGQIVSFVYDGANWVMEDHVEANTTYYGMTKLTNSVSSGSEYLAATAKAVQHAAKRAIMTTASYSFTIASKSYGGHTDLSTPTSSFGGNYIPLAVYLQDSEGLGVPMIFTHDGTYAFRIFNTHSAQYTFSGTAIILWILNE